MLARIVPLLWRLAAESFSHHASTATPGDQTLDTNRLSVKLSEVETSDRN